MSLRENILQSLRQRPAGLQKSTLRKQLIEEGEFDNEAFKEVFHDLNREGVIFKKKGGLYVLSENTDNVPGRLTVTSRGFGFVRPDAGTGEDGDIFIPPKGLHTALSGDRVLVSVGDRNDPRGPSGTIVRVLEAKRQEVVGTFAMLEGVPYFRPMHRDMPEWVPLIGPEDIEEEEWPPEDGSWVLVRILPRESQRDPLETEFIRTINADDTLTADLDAIVEEFNLPEPYTRKQEKDAAHLSPRNIDREDCRHLTALTIDPVDAKDHDDAISLQAGETDGTVVAGIHIADVAAYVAPGSKLDEEAAGRGFTAYLPGRTLPMLPHPLAADLCSLGEGEDRPAHSVFLTLDEKTGEVLSARRTRSTVRVDRGLSFGEVQRFIDTDEAPDWSDAVREAVDGLVRLSALMRARRGKTEKFLLFDAPDIRVLCTENPPRILGLEKQQQNEANALVEEFMLAANTAVGEELQRQKIPGLYRIHPEPSERDLGEFRDWLRDSLSLDAGSLDTREKMNRFLERHRGTAVGTAMGAAFLRTMQRASYSATPSLHFGLGKTCYSHFTSPIRRYSDTLVHQQLWAVDTGGEPRSQAECAEIATRVTEQEANLDEATFAAQDRLKLRYLEERDDAGEAVVFEGVVTRVFADRSMLFLPELGLNGVLPHGGGHARKVRTRKTPKPPQCGNVIRVEVDRTDLVRNELALRRVSEKG